MKSVLAAALLLLPAPALAQEAAAPVSAAPATEKKICRAGVKTGSIMRSKPVCRTKGEWLAIDRANNAAGAATRAGANDMRNSGTMVGLNR